MFRICLFSIITIFSNAKDDIVVKEPQNPIATRKEYLWSRFQLINNIEKTPRIKLPITFTIKTFDPIIPNISGKDVILYLIYAPKIAPTAKKTNSIPFTTLIAF